MEPIIEVRDLTTKFATSYGEYTAVRGISFDLYPGEILGIVGESGSGKSVAMLSVLGLLPPPPRSVVTGTAKFNGRDLLTLPAEEKRLLRGSELSIVFQDPMSSLNPVLTIGEQIAESIRLHQPELSSEQVTARCVELLQLVKVKNAENRINQYPHEFSGGMRQRAMIAMAIANNPSVLIADEPTTALDVTVQAKVLEVLKDAQRETGASTVMITHDLGVVSQIADRVLVMYAGRIVEQGDVKSIFSAPRHPYTKALLESLPRLHGTRHRLPQISGQPPNVMHPPSGCSFHPRCPLGAGREKCATERPELIVMPDGHASACHFIEELLSQPAVTPDEEAKPTMATALVTEVEEPAAATSDKPEVLRVEDLHVRFRIRGRGKTEEDKWLRAVDGVSFSVRAGETLGLVGESGCGKTTTGRSLMRLVEPSAGKVTVLGRDITHLSRRQMRDVRRELQLIFQDPYGSLDPRMTVRDLVAEPLVIHKQHKGRLRQEVNRLLDLVGLSPDLADRHPHQFSGGQRQRIGIARAIALNPKVLVLDEPVSALDVSIQAQVINLLQDLQDQLGLAYVFISHDLAVVRQISQNIAIMNAGKIVEYGDRNHIYEQPNHDYTKELLGAAPSLERSMARLLGTA